MAERKKERERERGLAPIAEREEETERVASNWPVMQCGEQWWGGRASTGASLQLVSGLPHDEAVQALQVTAAVVLVALHARPEHDQGGVTPHLSRGEGENKTGLTSQVL